jgi:uncharacterized protein (TIGR03437 family)
MGSVRAWVYLARIRAWGVIPSLVGIATIASGQSLTLELNSSTNAVQSCSTSSSITLLEGQSPPASGLQWTLRYSPNDVLAVRFSPGPAADAAGKSLTCVYGAEASTCLLLGMNTNPIPAGAIAYVSFQISGSAAVGESTLQLTDVLGVTGDAVAIPGGGIGGTIGIAQTPHSGPNFLLSSVVNAASLLSGPVAPGEIVTIFGCGLGSPYPLSGTITSSAFDTSLGGTQVLFDGQPAPLLFVENDQVNAVVPYSIAGQRNTAVQVEYQGAKSEPAVLPVAPASPALFTLNSSGSGAGAILNPDLSLVTATNPARTGTSVALYATGEGQTEPAGVSGLICTDTLPKPVLPVAVLIGGLPAEVEYAGCAPNSVSGLLQVNARVPEDLAPGNWPIRLMVGATSSPATVTIDIAGP